MLTDHKPLLGLFPEKKGIPNMVAARMQRWAILLSAHDYTLKYRSGAENSNADCGFLVVFHQMKRPLHLLLKMKFL